MSFPIATRTLKRFIPQKKRGVVPKYQGVVNQLKNLYEGDEDTLIKMSVTSILNVLIGFVMHNSDDTLLSLMRLWTSL